jgi:hypothetical protein
MAAAPRRSDDQTGTIPANVGRSIWGSSTMPEFQKENPLVENATHSAESVSESARAAMHPARLIPRQIHGAATTLTRKDGEYLQANAARRQQRAIRTFIVQCQRFVIHDGDESELLANLIATCRLLVPGAKFDVALGAVAEARSATKQFTIGENQPAVPRIESTQSQRARPKALCAPLDQDLGDHTSWHREEVDPDRYRHRAVPLGYPSNIVGTLAVLVPCEAMHSLDEPMEWISTLALFCGSSISEQRRRHDLSTRVSQLQTALGSRILIEQAKGMIAAKTESSIDAAFTSLRAISRRRNQKIQQTAHDVIAGVLKMDQLHH